MEILYVTNLDITNLNISLAYIRKGCTPIPTQLLEIQLSMISHYA